GGAVSARAADLAALGGWGAHRLGDAGPRVRVMRRVASLARLTVSRKQDRHLDILKAIAVWVGDEAITHPAIEGIHDSVIVAVRQTPSDDRLAEGAQKVCVHRRIPLHIASAPEFLHKGRGQV